MLKNRCRNVNCNKLSCSAVKASAFVLLNILQDIFRLFLGQSQVLSFFVELFNAADANEVAVETRCDVRGLKEFRVQPQLLCQVLVPLQAILLMVAGIKKMFYYWT